MYVTTQGVQLRLSDPVNNWIPSHAVGSVTGTPYNDIFYANAGDRMAGGAGDDHYDVWSMNFSIDERAGGGVDTLYDYGYGPIVLPDQVENLFLMGPGATAGTGNAQDNIIVAGSIGATLDGGGGNDVLVGGAGADTFVLHAGNGTAAVEAFGANDVVRLDGYGITSFAGLMTSAVQDGADVRFALPGGDTLVLRDTVVGMLGAADFQLVNSADAPPAADPFAAPVSGSGLSQIGTAGGFVTAGDWHLLNNVWNAGSLVEGRDYRVTATYHAPDLTSATSFSWAFPTVVSTQDAYVRAYPELIFGVSPWGIGQSAADSGHVFPVEVGALTALNASYDLALGGHTRGYDVAFDLWLTGRAGGDSSTITNEVMVWLHQGDVKPSGIRIGSYVDGDFAASIYRDVARNYTAIVADSDTPAGSVDIAKILHHLVDLGIVSAHEYLADVELGAEVVDGTGTLTINHLALDVESRGAGGATTVATVTGTGTQVTTLPAALPAPAAAPAAVPTPTAAPAVVPAPAAAVVVPVPVVVAPAPLPHADPAPVAAPAAALSVAAPVASPAPVAVAAPVAAVVVPAPAAPVAAPDVSQTTTVDHVAAGSAPQAAASAAAPVDAVAGGGAVSDPGRFVGSAANAVVVVDGAGVLHVAIGAQDTAVAQVEHLQFADATAGTAHAAEIVDDYLSLMGRAPSAAELAVWDAGRSAATTSAAMSAVIAGASSDAALGAYIATSYRDYLGRAPVLSEIAVWTGMLRGGTATPVSFTTLLAGVAQHEGHLATFVAQEYQTYLGRAPTAAEIGVWTTALTTGASDDHHMQIVLAAQPGSAALTVQHLYDDDFGRDPLAAETAYWAPKIADGLVSAAQLRGTLLADPTGAQHSAAVVTGLYQTYFGRAASDGEIAVWNGQLTGGATFADVRTALVADPTGQAHTSAVIDGLYQTDFGRAATPAELAVWQGAAGSGTGFDAVDAALKADAGSLASKATVIQEQYDDYFGRDPAAAELSFWQHKMASANDTASLRTALVNAPEGKDHISTLITATYTDDAGRNPTTAETTAGLTQVQQGATLTQLRQMITGGSGADTLVGADGAADTFRLHPGDTGNTLATAVHIEDFSHAQGDHIDLSPMAGLIAGHLPWTLHASGNEHVAGAVWITGNGTDYIVNLDTNGDGNPDAIIHLTTTNPTQLTTNDFIF